MVNDNTFFDKGTSLKSLQISPLNLNKTTVLFKNATKWGNEDEKRIEMARRAKPVFQKITKNFFIKFVHNKYFSYLWRELKHKIQYVRRKKQ